MKTAQETLDQVRTNIKAAKNGLFATKATTMEAEQFARDVLKSTAPEQMESMTSILIGVYHNTLLDGVLGMLDFVETKIEDDEIEADLDD